MCMLCVLTLPSHYAAAVCLSTCTLFVMRPGRLGQRAEDCRLWLECARTTQVSLIIPTADCLLAGCFPCCEQ
jgi:hypothetical protein